MPGSLYHQQITHAVEAVDFHRSGAVSWFGRTIFNPSLRQHLAAPEFEHRQLVLLLQQHLYECFYCPGGATPSTEAELFATEPANFEPRLVKANHGKGCWEDGWRVVEREHNGLIVEKDHLRISVASSQARTGSLESGGSDPVAVKLRNHLPFLASGFYMAFGDSYLHEHSSAWIRLYWNANASGAVELMDAATSSLNSMGVPFRLKVLRKIEQSGRCDTAVLYIYKHDWARIRSWVAKTHLDLVERLGAQVPALTCKLGWGLAFAEDPGHGASFGLHRCRAIAEGLVSARGAGRIGFAGRLDAVIEQLTIAGINVAEPYLGPGSSAEEYSLHAFQAPSLQLQEVRPQLSLPELDESSVHREVARSICAELVRSAHWYGEVCNWLGAAIPGVAYSNSAQDAAIMSAIGPDLYRGSAGIALFLGEYYVLSGDDNAKHTAHGAINHAMRQLELVPSTSRLSLFSGWTGIAYAAVRLGMMLGDNMLFDAGMKLALEVGALHPGSEQDLLSGNAGAVLGLLALWKVTGNPRLLDAATRLGGAIAEAATVKNDRAFWRSRASAGYRVFVGLSHGAAGIGFALLELFKATSAKVFLEIAEKAFQFESSYFDETEGNWRDFRTTAGAGAFASHKSSYNRTLFSRFATGWCHGAPGIALSRLCAYRLTRSDQYLNQALRALSTTQAVLQNMLGGRISDFCLCHGAAGLAEILNFSSLIEHQKLDLGALANLVANTGSSRFASSLGKQPWPLGVNAVENGLMLGLAGIGLFYLRLIDPGIPSPLVAFCDATCW